MADSGDHGSRPTRLTAAALLLAGSVLLSRVLGYARGAILAHQIGAGAQTDAYRAAFQIPDMLNYFLAGGALSIAFIPLYSRARTQRGEAEAQRLFAKVLGTMTAVAVAATALLWWQAEALVRLQFGEFGGFDAATLELTVRLTRIVLPAQVFFVVGGLIRAVLMARGSFVSQALAPVFYNLGIIAGGLAVGATLGAEGFAWGALVGAAVGPLGMALLEARRHGLALRVRLAFFDRELWHYLAVAAPLMIGVTLLTVDEWFDRWFGSRLGTGVVAQLGYARQLMQAPVAVVGQALATAALPTLSHLWTGGRREELDRVLQDTLRVGIGLALLAGGAFFAFADPIVELLFRHGAFTAADAHRVAVLLRVFSLAVPAWVTQQIAQRAFYARGDTWRPMLLGSAITLAAVPLYWTFGRSHGAVGLASAGVIAMTANAALTLALARRLHGGPSITRLLMTGGRTALIAVAAVGAAIWAQPVGEGRFAALLAVALGGIAFAAVALVGLALVGDAPMKATLRRAISPRRRQRSE